MPLTQLTLSAKVTWSMQAATGIFGPNKQGPDSETFNLIGIDLTDWDDLFAAEYVLFTAAPTGLTATLAAGGSLTASTTYYYKITATAAVTNSQETTGSNEVSVTPTSGNQSVKLTWTQTPAATGYKLYRGTAAGSEDVLIATINSGSTLTFTDTGGAGSVGSPPSSMPADFIEFSLSSFTNLVGETVTPGHALSIIISLAGSGPDAKCLLAPGNTNGLTWFFSGTSPGINIPVTPSSGNGGVFVLSGAKDDTGAVIDATHNSLRLTNGGTGNLNAVVIVITGP